jgi:hypothetical protein
MSFQKDLPKSTIIKKAPSKLSLNKQKTKSVSLKDFIFAPSKTNEKKENSKEKAIEFKNYIMQIVDLYTKENTNIKQKKKIGDILDSMIILRNRLQMIDELYDSDMF